MVSRTRNIMVKKKSKHRRSGYNQKFRFNVNLNDYGVPGEMLNWCKKRSDGKWGWWFRDTKRFNHDWQWYPEQTEAYMSFQYKRDALRFWFWWQRNLKDLQE